ncbi:MAG: septum formation initiator family protein [Deltaproteobacteria bacterium]|jgi:cell division protein FtsB|nr:septum formation initiator family protein [Deltaproteobacteria bacterium]
MIILEKAGLYLSIFTIIALLALIVLSKNGVLDYMALKQNKTAVHDQVDGVDFKNQKVENEIISLKTDMGYIKHVAKHEHDMAEEDELIFKDNSVNKGNIK